MYPHRRHASPLAKQDEMSNGAPFWGECLVFLLQFFGRKFWFLKSAPICSCRRLGSDPNNRIAPSLGSFLIPGSSGPVCRCPSRTDQALWAVRAVGRTHVLYSIQLDRFISSRLFRASASPWPAAFRKYFSASATFLGTPFPSRYINPRSYCA
jgi:hypothetical protein